MPPSEVTVSGQKELEEAWGPSPPLPCHCDYHCPGHPLTLQPRHSPRALAHISLGVVTVPCPGTARVSHSFSSMAATRVAGAPSQWKTKGKDRCSEAMNWCLAEPRHACKFLTPKTFFFLMALVFPDHVVSDLGLRLEHVFSVNLPC